MVSSVKLQMRGGGQVPADLQGLVAVTPGQPLSARAVRRSIERLFSTGRFSDVIARGDESPEGLVVTFELAPVIRIARIDVTGARALGKDEILTAARLQVGSEFWPERLDEARAALLAAYARRGWNRAEISTTVQPSGDQVVVKLNIHEGEPTRVSALRFEGSPGFPGAGSPPPSGSGWATSSTAPGSTRGPRRSAPSTATRGTPGRGSAHRECRWRGPAR